MLCCSKYYISSKYTGIKYCILSNVILPPMTLREISINICNEQTVFNTLKVYLDPLCDFAGLEYIFLAQTLTQYCSSYRWKASRPTVHTVLYAQFTRGSPATFWQMWEKGKCLGCELSYLCCVQTADCAVFQEWQAQLPVWTRAAASRLCLWTTESRLGDRAQASPQEAAGRCDKKCIFKKKERKNPVT